MGDGGSKHGERLGEDNEERRMNDGYERTFVGVSEAWNLAISARSQIDRNNSFKLYLFDPRGLRLLTIL